MVTTVVAIVLATFFFVVGRAARNDSTCIHVIFKNTTDDVELNFLKHLEMFLEEHETTQTVSSFLNEGQLLVAMRFFIELNSKAVHFQPQYLILNAASKFDDKFVITSLKNWDEKSLQQMLRVSFEKAHHKYNTVVKSDQQFDVMLLDETILKYLESFHKQQYILYVTSILTFNKTEIQSVEILYGIRNNCGLRDPSKRLDLSITRSAHAGITTKEIGYVPPVKPNDSGNTQVADNKKQNGTDYQYE